MNGNRMNQLVAPTSFITETSRRRAKMAMRMVLRISTEADSRRTTATVRKTHCSTRITLCMVLICWPGYLTSYTPGFPWNAW